MADDNWYQDSDEANRSFREDPSYGADAGYVQPKPGMSTGVKVLIGFMIVGGVAVLVCCGGIAFFGYKFAQMTTEDPEEIRTIQEGIADIDVPDTLTPKAGVNAQVMGVGMQMAVYEDGDSVLMLMQMNGPPGMDAAQMRQQFQQQLDQQGQNRNIEVESSEQRDVTIAGEETTIEIVKGKDGQGKEMRQVNGVFQGKGGAAFIVYICPEENWDEERAIGIFESIQTGAHQQEAGAGNDMSEPTDELGDTSDKIAEPGDVNEAETGDLPAE
ncbi:MAG: hypothetical protein R3B91_15210 [Planctomycetaceae bacterium]